MTKLLCAMGALLLAALFAAPASATNCSTYPYTLANGQTADATQVMADLNSILTCANANLAHNGANSDISSLSGLTTPLSAAQGGTGYTAFPFEFYAFVGGVTGNGWLLASYVPTTNVVLTTAKSACIVGTAATSTTTYTLKDNGGAIGTAVVTGGATTCVATITSSPYTVIAGHTLSITGPATGDATLADIGMTFGGTRN